MTSTLATSRFAPATVADRELLQFVRAFVTMQSRNAPKTTLRYRGMYHLLSIHGRFWQPATLAEKRGRMKACFHNAFRAVTRSNGQLRYVEGIATGIIPCHHAWAVDASGAVIETTWPTIGSSYFGVVLTEEQVRYARIRGCTSPFGLIESHREDGRHIYETPFEEDANV